LAVEIWRMMWMLDRSRLFLSSLDADAVKNKGIDNKAGAETTSQAPFSSLRGAG
jgi:hypothetical protein